MTAAIPGGYQNSTVANCVTACAAGGFSYAGLEYYGECCTFPFTHPICTIVLAKPLANAFQIAAMPSSMEER